MILWTQWNRANLRSKTWDHIHTWFQTKNEGEKSFLNVHLIDHATENGSTGKGKTNYTEILIKKKENKNATILFLLHIVLTFSSKNYHHWRVCTPCRSILDQVQVGSGANEYWCNERWFKIYWYSPESV